MQTTWLLHIDRIALAPWLAEAGNVELSEEVGEGLRVARWHGDPPKHHRDFDWRITPRNALVRFALSLDHGASLLERIDSAHRRGVKNFVAQPLRSRGETPTREAAEIALSLGMSKSESPLPPDEPILFALGTDACCLTGISTPRAALSPFPAGRFFSRAKLSRAGGKLAEALAYADAFLQPIPWRGRWLELGAFPGGMTSVLATQAQHITAIDRRECPEALIRATNLAWHAANVEHFNPGTASFDALVCDLNGPNLPAAQTIARLVANLTRGAVLIYTLKLSQWEDLARDLYAVGNIFTAAGIEILTLRHFCANRREMTLISKLTE